VLEQQPQVFAKFGHVLPVKPSIDKFVTPGEAGKRPQPEETGDQRLIRTLRLTLPAMRDRPDRLS
jgi:hypothetical protein